MRAIWRSFKAVLLIGLGAILAVVVSQCGADKFPSQWFTLAQPPERTTAAGAKAFGGGVSVSTEVVEQAISKNAPIPEVESVSGKVKFLTSGARGNDYQVPLGYEAEIKLASTKEQQAVIEQRRKMGLTNRGELIRFPKTVDVRLDFVLKDKDGFVLQEVQGERHYLLPGEAKVVKGITTNAVGAANAQATKDIACEVFISGTHFPEDTEQVD
jgi:hypothetical protein